MQTEREDTPARDRRAERQQEKMEQLAPLHKHNFNLIIIGGFGVMKSGPLSLFLGCMAVLPGPAYCHTVDYQIHSNNDLLEWPQLFLKGARRFKVDPHYVPTEQCEVLGIHSTDGCLLLNHDRPIVKFNQLYNSTDDLLSFLSSALESPKYDLVDKITVALCFKEAPDYCSEDSARFQSWLRLVDSMHEQAVGLFDPGRVEFILDGDGKPMNCLLGRWKDWNSVWINTGGPQEAFYSNSIENDYYRFQVLNDPENIANWTWMASGDVNYGKFSDGKYPYQLWEPDAQQDILEYIDVYSSGKEHDAGFHFAINVDIAMFEVYSKGSTGRALNQPILGTTGAIRPLINPLSLESGEFGNLVVYGFDDDSSRRVAYSVLATKGAVGGKYPSEITVPVQAFLSDSASAWLFSQEGDNLVASDVLSDGGDSDILAVLSNGGHFILAKLSSPSYVVSTILTGKFSSDDEAESFHDAKIGLCTDFQWLVKKSTDSSSLCAVTLSEREGPEGNAQLDIRAYELKETTGTGINTKILTELILIPPGASTEIQLTTAKMLLVTPSEESAAFVAVLCAHDGVVYGSEIDSTSIRFGNVGAANWVAISVGGHISVSEAGGVVILVSDFGFCANSHKHNTRAYPTVCAATPVSSETVLDYSIGLLSDWKRAFSSSKCQYSVESGTPCVELSACHGSILHGSFDQGTWPSVGISYQPSTSDSNDTYFFLEVHKGLPISALSSLSQFAWKHDSLSNEHVEMAEMISGRDNGCGIPLASNELIVDSFDISRWVSSMQINSD